MHIFEAILVLLLVSTLLSLFARRLGIPYPTVLAITGAAVAFVPGAPSFELPPEMILALFVAPILLDAAYDSSLRDLRANWLPISSLALVAVGLTTAAVAVGARWYFPDMPWAAAIALGALVAPPDAVAALAVLRQVNPPYRIRSILEGESLLNDASALLIYKLAVAAATAGSFSLADAAPAFGAVFIGSVAVGWAVSWPVGRLVRAVDDAATSTILQFIITFALWIFAEEIGLSAVVTIVVFGISAARRSALELPARLRIPSFAIWETITFVLNVLAFTLIGLQLAPILENLRAAQWGEYVGGALLLLGLVIVVRLFWVTAYTCVHALVAKAPDDERESPGAKSALVIGWSGMRGIVTLGAALAIPEGFPYRAFIQFAAFTVVLGTLLLQGLTLKPLVEWLKLPRDDVVETEIAAGRAAALKAAMNALSGDESAAAQRLREQFREALLRAKAGEDPHAGPDYAIRRQVLPASRAAIHDLRKDGTIGDAAYQAVQEELDWLELSSMGGRMDG